MVSERRNSPEQERSINERKRELYVADDAPPPPQAPVKPFVIYLKETPADPMSTGVKVLLWILGIVVLLLFVAALWRIQRSPRLRPRPAAKAAAIHVPTPVRARVS